MSAVWHYVYMWLGPTHVDVAFAHSQNKKIKKQTKTKTKEKQKQKGTQTQGADKFGPWRKNYHIIVSANSQKCSVCNALFDTQNNFLIAMERIWIVGSQSSSLHINPRTRLGGPLSYVVTDLQSGFSEGLISNIGLSSTNHVCDHNNENQASQGSADNDWD